MIDPKAVDEVDKTMTQVVRSLDRRFLQHCKAHFESNFLNLCGENLELKLVVDASAVIPDMLAYVKDGKSKLLELSQSPFFKLHAPPWLKSELDKKIPELATKKGLDEGELRKFVTMFLAKVETIEGQDEKGFRAAFAAVGHRDPNDVPYVAVYLSIKSHGILTKDKDIIEAPEIKTWRTGMAGKVVTVFEKGTFSFLVLTKAVPPTFRLLYEICVTVLKSIWEVAQIIGQAILGLIDSGVKAISKMSDLGKLIAISLILYDKTRNAIVEAAKNLAGLIGDMIRWFHDSIKSLLEILAPIVGISLTIIHVLFQHLNETINTYKTLEGGPSTTMHANL